MTKYRLRLSNGRVIGPFTMDQLHELKSKNHITGKEEAQVFPIGNWAPIASFDFYSDLMDENRTAVLTNNKEETFVLDLTKLRNDRNSKELDAIDITHHDHVEPLTSTMQMAPPSKLDIKLDQEKSKDSSELMRLAAENEDSYEPTETDAGNKTIINPVAQQEIEKMRRLKAIQEEKRLAEEAKLKAEQERKEKEKNEQNQVVPVDESTQMITLDNFKDELLEIAKVEEKKIQVEAKAIKKKLKKEAEKNEDDQDEGAGPKRKKIIFLVVGILAICALLFPDENKPKPNVFVPLEVNIQFPLPFDVADKKMSEVEFNKGLEELISGTYPELIKAGISFKKSFEHNIDNMKSLSYMVRVYGEEVQFSREKEKDKLTIFNIIQGKKPYLLEDPNGAIGMSLFYTSIGKHEAAADSIGRYLKIHPKNVTPDLFAVYLQSLIRVGKLDLATPFYKSLVPSPRKSRYVLNALIDYTETNEQSDEAISYVEEGLKRFPHLTSFSLKKIDRLIKQKNIKEAEEELEKVKKLNFESNRNVYAKYLEYRGLICAFRDQVKEATEYLKKSLSMLESYELRMKLAELNSSGEKNATDKLIDESKAVKFLNDAKDFYGKNNFEKSLSMAIKATDAFPGHIPSELFLSKVQLKLGLAEKGLETLSTLQKMYPEDKDINFALLEAYIETYKFYAASNQLAFIRSTNFKNDLRVPSLNARMFMKKGDSLQAINWLKTSINLDPLNDRDMFYMAELLIKRSNFDAAKVYLNKCIELDPSNPDYRIAYAKMLYETQDDQAAIGYLLGLQNDFGETPKILSEIAIFYYRSGRVKDFEDFKAKLEKLPNKDSSLYEFLIRAALLDEKYNEIPGLVEKLLEVEPGNLESMMTAGKVLFENDNLPLAAQWFKRVQKKLSTYPKVQYYIAKIKFLAGEIDDPKDASGQSLKDENGKVILGAMNTILDDIKNNGETDISLVLLAEILNKQDKLIEAENTLKKAQKINPRSYEALMGLAEISTKRNNYDLALDLFKKALHEKNDDPIIHKKIGDVYRLLGQGALAMESYKVYLEMNPDASDKAQIEAYINIMK